MWTLSINAQSVLALILILTIMSFGQFASHPELTDVQGAPAGNENEVTLIGL